jgi:hypothetical protein
VTYAATIRYADGTSAEIPETEAKRTTIQLGDVIADRLDVSIVPDLLDFAAIKLVNVSLNYEDEANGLNEREDMIFKTGDTAKTWHVDLKDKQKTGYVWSARFFLADGTRREVPATPSKDLTLLLELPTA